MSKDPTSVQDYQVWSRKDVRGISGAVTEKASEGEMNNMDNSNWVLKIAAAVWDRRIEVMVLATICMIGVAAFATWFFNKAQI